jgi:hypothetical protein
MKRIVLTFVFAGVVGLAGMPRSAEAGIFGRWFGCRSSGSDVVTTAAPNAGATADAGRRYSYEPTVVEARRTTSDGVLPGQRHLLPKTDPRRYMGN